MVQSKVDFVGRFVADTTLPDVQQGMIKVQVIGR
jgi:hypothetical protein